MQLRTARLCLDCEEVHAEQQCPACASETFAFITRWVPAPERRARPREPEPARPEELQAYRTMLEPEDHSSAWTVVRRGAMGLALFGVAGWMWRRGTPGDSRESPAPAAGTPAPGKDSRHDPGPDS
jgi:hypothetical protein